MEPRTKDSLLTVLCALGSAPWVALLIGAIAQPTGDPPWARWLILEFMLGMVSPFSTVAAIVAWVWHIRHGERIKAAKYFLLAVSAGAGTAFAIQMAIGWYEYTSTG